jgi:two-component system sensor histidine kinase UhpB
LFASVDVPHYAPSDERRFLRKARAMNMTLNEGGKVSAHRDLALIAIAGVAAASICARLSERMLAWTRPFERLQLDELPAVLLVVAVSLIWFASRRFFEASRELRLRRAAELRLAAALAENQRLSEQYVFMQENERKASSRDLHDERGQYLNADAILMRDATTTQLAERDVARAMIVNIDRVSGVVASLVRQCSS